jgi:hypothetical protein
MPSESLRQDCRADDEPGYRIYSCADRTVAYTIRQNDPTYQVKTGLFFFYHYTPFAIMGGIVICLK